MSTPSTPLVRRAALALAAASLLGALAPAHAAWEASATTENFDVNFMVGSVSGSYTWTTVQEAWGATFSNSGSIPNEYTFQGWDGQAWEQADFGNIVSLPGSGFVGASWSRESINDALARTGQASVQGPLANGLSAGAFALYEFTLEVAAFSSVEIQLLESDQFVYLARDAGDEGVAFGGFKLYAPGLDLNVPGGSNQAYFNGQMALGGGSTAAVEQGSTGLLNYTFENQTNQTQTHQLRFEVSALVFTTPPVPEPQTWALWLTGLAVMGALVRRRARQA